jgi:hypothetical protein
MGKLPEEKVTQRRKEEFKRKSSRNESSESSGDERRQKWKEDARNIIAQARVNNSRYAWKEENYKDDDKEMGALCFTRRVRKTRVPKGFKLPHDQQKYDGSQEPTLLLSDYLQAVQILGGTRAMAMQKFAVTPHRRSMVLVEHFTQRFHRELGRTREPIRKKLSLNI